MLLEGRIEAGHHGIECPSLALPFPFPVHGHLLTMPNFRHTSATGVPASACWSANAICWSVNFDFFIGYGPSWTA